jgi:SAM-dependent methyltransferase
MDDALRAYYQTGVELGRLERGYWRLEFARTKELLLRYLPPAPVQVLDVGGGPGAYAEWLADAGYEVKLVDALAFHVQHAQELARGRFVAEEGDARALEETDESHDVVLLLGPLYHLLDRADRMRALAEAHRVLRPGGLLAAAAISRFGPLLDAFLRGTLNEVGVSSLAERAIADGRHVPDPENPVFTTAYFHFPEELEAEVHEAAFEIVELLGVEGPGWLRAETLDSRDGLETAARVARAIEGERAIIGASAHLLAIARRS